MMSYGIRSGKVAKMTGVSSSTAKRMLSRIRARSPEVVKSCRYGRYVYDFEAIKQALVEEGVSAHQPTPEAPPAVAHVCDSATREDLSAINVALWEAIVRLRHDLDAIQRVK
jgi:hypothetical protein